MSVTADLEKARLSVLLDVRHPLAYLALHPTLAFAESLGLEANWLPLTVPPLHPPSAACESDDRGVRHRRHRAHAVSREIETYGAAQGLVLREYYRDESADAANLGWLWVRDRHPEKLHSFLVEIFRAYWADEIDASDADQVAGVIDAVAADRASFLGWSAGDGPSAAAALAAEIRDHGLFQVPAYVVEAEVFYGRQHLPMIRWILGGRSGRGPI